MAKWECSLLNDKLEVLIKEKEQRLDKLTENAYAFKKTQEEIVLLKDIQCYVQAESNIFSMVVIDLIGKALMRGIDKGLNGIVCYMPIHNKYKDKVKVGVFNPSLKNTPVCFTCEDDERNQILLHNFRYDVHNIDGIGEIEPEIIHLTNDI